MTTTDMLGTTGLTAHADAVCNDLREQERLWSRGFTRRRFLQGVGMAGVAALGTQLVTTRAAFADPATSNGNTLVVIFLRGGCDWLRVLVPDAPSLGGDYLRAVRPGLVPGSSALRPLDGAGGWAANGRLSPLLPLWGSGELAFVPAVATSPTRSHFDAQRFLETGGAPTSTNGWLDRLLTSLGPGTTFRAVASGYSTPVSMLGTEQKLTMATLQDFAMPSWGDDYETRAVEAMASLYRGLPGSLPEDVATTVQALDTAAAARAAAGAQNGAAYPSNNEFARSLADLATMLRAEVGLQVATVDVGGWDTHTDEANDLDNNVDAVARSLAAFMTDLGPQRRSRVTVAVMSEFGRRVAQNGSGGSDHGYGGLMWLLGGGLASAQVAGTWKPLSDGVLDQGDVAALNSPFDVLGELATVRLGAGSLSGVFPGASLGTLGIARAA
ncbi:DUF1501 domain-containing protein [Jatrophihabitans sp. YIM 134969]